jgi:hypothetical protein
MRRASKAAKISLVVLIFACVSLKAFHRFELHRAGELVEFVRDTTLSHHIARAQLEAACWTAFCDGSGCSYQKWTTNAPFFFRNEFLRSAIFDRVWPARRWAVLAYIDFGPDESLTGSRVHIFQDNGYADNELIGTAFYAQHTGPIRCNLPERIELLHPGYSVRIVPRTQAPYAQLHLDSSPEEIREAYDFNLGCLESWHSCSSPEELAPKLYARMAADRLWRDAHKKELADAYAAACPTTTVPPF